MGTRSLTYIHDPWKDDEGKENDRVLVNMYRQLDGYPSGHGQELAEFLCGRTIVNGINNTTPKRAANGMGCLAAQMVAHFKDGIGNIYLHTTELHQNCWQDYEYHVYPDKVIIYSMYETDKTMFEGTWQEFGKYCNKEYEEDNQWRNNV